MNYEVEQKDPVADFSAVEASVLRLGGTFGPAERQVDRYFNHPAKDFAETDEALRIRSIGERNFVTYKGARVDAATKTRREIEVPVAPGTDAAGQFAELLTALGFRETAVVDKSRRAAHLTRSDFTAEVTLDVVREVGSFVEIEVLADETSLEAAKAELARLAADLSLTKTERRSYLELLLEQRGS